MAKRPSPTSKPRWAKRSEIPPIAQGRPRLTEADVAWLKAQMRERYKWSSDPKLFQLEGVKAQLEGVDMIIQAPTGSGKTALAAGPHLWPSSKGKTTIMVCPLLALENEMVDTFANEFGLSAVAINSVGGKLTSALEQDLISGKFQVILISPEMLQSPAFLNRVMRKPEFARRVLSIFIDEAHCVSHWGANFRKKYGTLGTVRAFLPRGTPVIAVTATLTARVRRDLHRVLLFPKVGSRFFNVGNDRPNVTIVVRAMEHPQNTYADLDFLIPSTLASPLDIPKTYLYVDDIKAGGEIIDHLNSLLITRHPELVRAEVIRPYNASMPSDYLVKAMAAFRANPPPSGLPTDPDATPDAPPPGDYVRILVCTDAAGMGCNVKDIAQVVQWKLPKTLSSFVQRAGRAARSPFLTGTAVLLVERTVYSVDMRPAAPTAPVALTPAKASGKTRRKTGPKSTAAKALPKGYAHRHGIDRGGTTRDDAVQTLPEDEVPTLDHEASDEGLRTFVQTNTCRRKIWADVFESQLGAPAAGVPCCDNCDPSVFNGLRPGARRRETKPKMRAKGKPDFAAFDRLEAWRERIYERDLTARMLDPTAVLTDDTITQLVSLGPLTAVQVASIMKDSWIWWSTYGEELCAYVAQLSIRYTPIPKTRSRKNAAAPGPSIAQLTAAVPPTPNPMSVTPRKRPLSLEVDVSRSKQPRSESEVPRQHPTQQSHLQPPPSAPMPPMTPAPSRITPAHPQMHPSTPNVHFPYTPSPYSYPVLPSGYFMPPGWGYPTPSPLPNTVPHPTYAPQSTPHRSADHHSQPFSPRPPSTPGFNGTQWHNATPPQPRPATQPTVSQPTMLQPDVAIGPDPRTPSAAPISGSDRNYEPSGGQAAYSGYYRSHVYQS